MKVVVDPSGGSCPVAWCSSFDLRLGRRPRSGRHAWQTDARSVAENRQAFKAHVAPADRPLVVLLEHERADEPDESSPYNVAGFQWRALWDRRSLRAGYGEGFRSDSVTERKLDVPGRPAE